MKALMIIWLIGGFGVPIPASVTEALFQNVTTCEAALKTIRRGHKAWRGYCLEGATRR